MTIQTDDYDNAGGYPHDYTEEQEYDSGHESMETLEIRDDFTKDYDNDLKKDTSLHFIVIEEAMKPVKDNEDDNKQEERDTCVPIPENEPLDYPYPMQRLPYHDLVSVLERTTSISSRMDLNHLSPTDAMIRSTTFSMRTEVMSTESLAKPKPMGLLRRALTLSHASSLAQAGGEYHMGSLADVYHSIQSLRIVKKVEDPREELPSKRTLIKNYVFACIGHFLIMMSFLPLRSIQTSLNHKDNLGSICTSAQLACYVVGALLTPVVVPKLGIKRTMCTAMSLPLLFVLGNFYSSFISLLPGSMITGVSMAILYSTQAIYQTGIAYAYSVHTDEPLNQVLPLFVAVYLATVQFSGVIGNLLTSTILKFLPPFFVNTITVNETIDSAVMYNLSHATQCGAGFCHEYLDSDTSNSDVSRPVLYILLGVLGLCLIMGVMFASCGMDKDLDRLFVKSPGEQECCGWDQWKGWIDLHKDVRMVLILILASFTAFMPSFIFADSMKAYVTCPLGLTMLGYVTVCYGLSNALTTALTGPLARRIGWTNILYLGFTITLVVFLIKLFWYPVPGNMVLIFVMFAVCGAVDPLYISPCYGIIGVMFSDRSEHAFSLLTIYQALVSSAAYALSPLMCMTTKIYLTLAYLFVTVVCYSALEIIVRREDRKNVKLDIGDVDT